MLAFGIFGRSEAAKLKAYMKMNRKWVDRSGDAKRALDCKFEQGDNYARFVLSQGVEYGIWLEICNEKQYAILEPTVRLKGPEVLDNMNLLFEKMGGL